MAKYIPSGRDEDGKPIDDAVDFDLRYRQEQNRKLTKGKRAAREMRGVRDTINSSLQSYRDRLKWVDSKGEPID